MKKEYWLIRESRNLEDKNPLQLVDKTRAKSIKDAEKEFERRNDFKELLSNATLVIAKSERWLR